MKRLLAYLFIVLGLGLLFSVNINASDKTLKSAMKINKKEKVIYSGKFGNSFRWGNPIPLKINDLRGDGNVYYVIDSTHTYYRLNEDYKVISTGKFKFKKATDTLVLTEDNQKFFWKVSLSSKVVDIKSKFYDHKGYRRYQFVEATFKEHKQINSSIKNFEQGSYAVYDDSDVNLNRLHELIMKDKNVKKSKYLKYSKKGKFNGKKIKTMGLAVFIDYEKELSKLTKDKNLKEISISAWGWDYSTEDQTGFVDGWKAIKNCYKSFLKNAPKQIVVIDGKCILVDTRRITGDSQNPIIWENYLIKERDNRILIAKNLEKSKKTKKQLAKEEKKEEAKKKKLLSAQKKAEEERKKQEKILAEKKKEEEKRKNELLLAQIKAKDEKKKQKLLLAQKKAEEERKKQELLLAQKKAEEKKKKQELQELLLAQKKAEEEKKKQELIVQQKAEEGKKLNELELAKKEASKEFEKKKKELNVDKDSPEILVAEVITVSSQVYKLKGKVKDRSDFFLEIDGQPVEINEQGEFLFEGFVIDTKKGEELTIVAVDRWNNSSEKNVKIKVEIEETKVAKRYEKLLPHKVKVNNDKNKIAIIIGIEKYKQAPAASFANLDATYFYEYARRGFGISPSNMKLLVDEDANLIKSLGIISKWLPGKVVKNQTELIIFFAGHGLASTDGKELYFLTQDSDPDLLTRTALSRTELFKEIISLEPKSVTMFMDTCYSGISRDEEILLASARPIRIVADEQEGVPDNFTIFTASQLDQISSGLKEANHGIFSYYLMKGLEGKADSNKDKQITNGELLAYMDRNVSQKASELGRQQNPSLAGDRDQVLISYR